MSNEPSIYAPTEVLNNDYRTDIFTAIESRLDYMTTRFTRVCVVLFIVRFPLGYYHPSPTTLFSDFIAALSKNLSRKAIAFQRVSVCEKNTSSMPHYHVVIMLDGNRINSSYGIGQKADELWASKFSCSVPNGLVDYTNQSIGKNNLCNGLMLDRKDISFSYLKSQVLDTALYFSKRFSKGGMTKNMHEVMCSQLAR